MGLGCALRGGGASGDEASQVRGGHNMCFSEELGTRGQSPQIGMITSDLKFAFAVVAAHLFFKSLRKGSVKPPLPHSDLRAITQNDGQP